MTRIAEIVHGWLGWCPNGHAIKAKQGGHMRNTFQANTATVPGQDADCNDGTGKFSDGRYEHTQQGSVILGAVGVAIILILVSMLVFEPVLASIFVLAILVIVLAIMSRLTVSVTGKHLKIRFGPVGLVQKEWLLSEIISATPVTNQWMYGWGIRWTPHGTLYNVAGSHAVEILLQTGEKVRIGTDEPERLCRALQQAGTGIITMVSE